MTRPPSGSLLRRLVLLALLCALIIPAVSTPSATAANPLDTFMVELRAQLQADGRIEFGLRADGRVREPRARFIPAAVDHQRWFVSSALAPPWLRDAR